MAKRRPPLFIMFTLNGGLTNMILTNGGRWDMPGRRTQISLIGRPVRTDLDRAGSVVRVNRS